MKKILALLSLLSLAGCTCTMPRTLIAPLPDCQKGLPYFHKFLENNLLASERDVWIVDLEMFYSAELETCIGKYIAYRKEGKKDDMTLFFIRNIRKNEDIYYEKYTGSALRKEYEGQKKYQEKVAALRGT